MTPTWSAPSVLPRLIESVGRSHLQALVHTEESMGALVGDLTDNEADLTDKLLGVEPGGECTIWFDSPGGNPYCAMALATMNQPDSPSSRVEAAPTVTALRMARRKAPARWRFWACASP